MNDFPKITDLQDELNKLLEAYRLLNKWYSYTDPYTIDIPQDLREELRRFFKFDDSE